MGNQPFIMAYIRADYLRCKTLEEQTDMFHFYEDEAERLERTGSNPVKLETFKTFNHIIFSTLTGHSYDSKIAL